MGGPDLTIGQRLALAFGLPSSLLAAALWALSNANARQQEQHEALIESVAVVTEAAQELERRLFRVAIATRDYLLLPGPGRLAVAESSVNDARGALSQLEQMAAAPLGNGASRELRAVVDDYLQRTALVLSGPPAGHARRLQELTGQRESALRQLDAIRDLQKGQFVASLGEMQRAREKLVRQMLGVLLVVFTLTAGAGIVLADSLRVPLTELLAGAAAIERGDWSAARPWGEGVAARVRNEVRSLKRALGVAALALERRDRRLTADRRIADAAATSLEAGHIARRALAAIIEKLRGGLGVIDFADPGSAQLRPVASHATGAVTAPVAFGEGLAGQAAAERRVQVLRSVPADTPFRVRLGHEEAPPRCIVAVPVRFRDDVLGVVLIGTLHDLDDYSLAFLDSAAAQLAAGLQNALAHAELKKLADELREKHRLIQAQNEEIQARNEELKSLTEDLTLADTRKNEFIALVAHELRSPLAAIANGVQVLGLDDVTREAARETHAVIARQTQQLMRLVEDLLDITRVARGSLEVRRHPLDLVALVRDCADDLGHAVKDAGMNLAVALPAGPLEVAGDRQRLYQVTWNLVSNAIKFRQPAGTVRVSVEPGAREATLRVTDDGVGIDPAFMPRLFEPFTQAHPSFEAGAGLGLGLSLVKALVEAHGGSVEARSDGAGHGAEFIVRLPRA